jgi:malonyl-CoA O-methyltransferase
MTAPNPDSVPGLDPVAAQRWQQRRSPLGAWLHEEVSRRMAERLAWIVNKPKDWLAYLPHHSAPAGLQMVRAHCPDAKAWWPAAKGAQNTAQPWWRPTWLQPSANNPPTLPRDAAEAVDLVWANMALHVLPQPQEVMAQWLRQLRVQGFVMGSGLGPDSLQELRGVYSHMGWPPPAHNLTDMHDWGDMLVQAGFAEPVMDMERISLAYEDPGKLVTDLRAWGRNLSTERFGACRGKGHVQALHQALSQHLPRDAHGRMTLTLEIIYAHAVKPAPRLKVGPETHVSLQDMREMLKPKP